MAFYSACLVETIQYCITHYSQFFDPQSIQYASSILNLDADEISIISRVILRRHKWLRSDSLLHYVSDLTNFNVSFKNLVDLHHLIPLSGSFPFDDIFEAIGICLSSEEWKLIYKLLKLSDTKNNSTKAAIQTTVKAALLSQKLLFGTVESNILSLVGKVLCSKTAGTAIVSLDANLMKTIRRMQRLVQVSECVRVQP
jgi:hypothetical protein